jgi:hypothetical protein
MKTIPKAHLFSAIIVLIAIVLSIAIGSVFIPPQIIIKYLVDGLLGRTVDLTPGQPYSTIIFVLRLPRTALVAQPLQEAELPTRVYSEILSPIHT